MDERTRLGLGVLGAALFLGVLGDGLLRATPWGINLLVWVAALAGVAVAVAWRGRLRVAGEGRWTSSTTAASARCSPSRRGRPASRGGTPRRSYC